PRYKAHHGRWVRRLPRQADQHQATPGDGARDPRQGITSRSRGLDVYLQPAGAERVNKIPEASSAEVLYLRLRLLQPVRHPHLAIHRRRGGEVLTRLIALAGAPGELAEAEVAVGDEGPRGFISTPKTTRRAAPSPRGDPQCRSLR